MRLIARNTITRYIESLAGHKDMQAVRTALNAWFHEVLAAKWRTPDDVKRLYRNASIIDNQRVVFNIKGNDYRLVAAIDYRRQTVFIKWIGSHKEYDKIDVRKVKYGDQAYQKRVRPRGSSQ